MDFLFVFIGFMLLLILFVVGVALIAASIVSSVTGDETKKPASVPDIPPTKPGEFRLTPTAPTPFIKPIDLFAAHALGGVISRPGWDDPEKAAEIALKAAKAMCRALHEDYQEQNRILGDRIATIFEKRDEA